MTEVTASSIIDARLGNQMVGAVLSGDREVYVRFEKHSFETPGNFSYTLPDWATGYGVVISGGGGGGRAGNGGNRSSGNGGHGGEVSGMIVRISTSPGRVLSGTIGAGGVPRGGSHAYGDDGGPTTFITHAGQTYTVDGGTGNPTVSGRNGTVVRHSFSEPLASFFNKAVGEIYPTGPAGTVLSTGSGGAGQRGGGGAGGDGGIFNNYRHGGKGGDGFVDIYVWGMPPDEAGVRSIVLLTLGTTSQSYELRDKFRAELTARGLDYQTVTEIPFDIKFTGSGSVRGLFEGCSSLTTIPPLDTSQVTDMTYMFRDCSSLIRVPDMVTSQATITSAMFIRCSALTDGNVRLIGKHPNVATVNMITDSGLTRLPFYDSAGNPI